MLLTWGPQVSTPTFWTESWAKIQAKATWKAPDSTCAARMCLSDLWGWGWGGRAIPCALFYGMTMIC